MTAKQFTRRRRRLFKTQAQAAEALGVYQGTISSYETGHRPVPTVVIKLLECLEEKSKFAKLQKSEV